jgi:hypothetical protein
MARWALLLRGLPLDLEAQGSAVMGGLVPHGALFWEGGCRGPAHACLLLLWGCRPPPCLGISFLASWAAPCCALHVHPSLAVASNNLSDLKHWLEAIPSGHTLAFQAPCISHHHPSSAYGSPFRDSGPCGTPTGENSFLVDRALNLESRKQVLQSLSPFIRSLVLESHHSIFCKIRMSLFVTGIL